MDASNSPSCRLGSVWGISNYLTFRELLKYGYKDEARELCEKTIRLLGHDIIRFGIMYEYYPPDNGEPIINPGFQNRNMLVLNMIYWYKGVKASIARDGKSRTASQKKQLQIETANQQKSGSGPGVKRK